MCFYLGILGAHLQEEEQKRLRTIEEFCTNNDLFSSWQLKGAQVYDWDFWQIVNFHVYFKIALEDISKGRLMAKQSKKWQIIKGLWHFRRTTLSVHLHILKFWKILLRVSRITAQSVKIFCGPISISMPYASLVVSSASSYFTAHDTWSDFTPCPRCGPPTSYKAWWLCRPNGNLDNYKAMGNSPPGVHRSSGSGCSSAYILYNRFLHDPV